MTDARRARPQAGRKFVTSTLFAALALAAGGCGGGGLSSGAPLSTEVVGAQAGSQDAEGAPSDTGTAGTSTPTPTPTPTPTETATTPTAPPEVVYTPPSSSGTAPVVVDGTSVLATAAATLRPGESRQLDTTLSPEAIVDANASITQWGGSGVWDPIRHQVRYVGKRHSTYNHYQLIYNEVENSWRKEPVSSSLGKTGHGYDHNAIDPATGFNYFRRFGSQLIYQWNGASWSELPALTRTTRSVGSLSWFDGLGLVFYDDRGLSYYDGSRWHDFADPEDTGYHNVSEFNRTAGVLVFGGGNAQGTRFFKLEKTLAISRIADAPFDLGAAPTQGLLVEDPASSRLIAWKKGSEDWATYDITTNRWIPMVPPSSGNGSSPQVGPPNLGNESDVIAIPIHSYGIIMFIKYNGAQANASVWLYRHS